MNIFVNVSIPIQVDVCKKKTPIHRRPMAARYDIPNIYPL